MSIKLLGTIKGLGPKLFIAVSGGLDSMVCLDFLRNARHKVTVVSLNHGTEFGAEAEKFVESYCESHSQPAIFGNLASAKPSDQSWEEFWRNARYQFFEEVLAQFPESKLITCHHLDDVVETWVFTALNGRPRTIPYFRQLASGQIVRPFLLTPKSELKSWQLRHNVSYVEDPSNADVVHARNRIRHRIVPEALLINPGLHKVVAREVQSEYDEWDLRKYR